MRRENEYLPSNPKYFNKPLSIKQLPYMPSAAAYKIFTKRRKKRIWDVVHAERAGDARQKGAKITAPATPEGVINLMCMIGWAIWNSPTDINLLML